ncbi:MAG: hypothetical protein GXO22_02585 [Aquificae bacterium]|nr:hypothetical protein [Aquificota bacterium]
MEFLNFGDELREQILKLNQLVSDINNISIEINQTRNDIKILKRRLDNLV